MKTNLRTKRRLTLMALLLMGWVAVTLPWPMPFDRARWQQFHSHFRGMGVSVESDTSRARMVDQVIREKLKPGLSFEEGRLLLGIPEVEGSGHGPTTVTYQQDGYILAHQPLLPFPGIWLRWRTGDPYLWVRYERGKLVSATVE